MRQRRQGKELTVCTKRPSIPARRMHISKTSRKNLSPIMSTRQCRRARYTRKIPARHLFLHVRSSQSVWSRLPKVGVDAICHGATGKGNDQVRFELTVKALARKSISSPPGVSGISNPRGRDRIRTGAQHPVPVDKEHNYSMDANILASFARRFRPRRPVERTQGRPLYDLQNAGRSAG